MARYSDTLRDDLTQAPIEGALVSVIANATGGTASLTDDDGHAMANPFLTDVFGSVVFHGDPDYYDLEYHYGGRMARKDYNVPVFDGGSGPSDTLIGFDDNGDLIFIPIDDFQGAPGVPSGNAAAVPTRVVLAAIVGPVLGQVAYLSEAGREGWFKFSNANHAADVTADPGQGIWVATAAAPTGASGAWMRVHAKGFYQGSWWGVLADGVSDDTLAIQRGWNWAQYVKGGVIHYAAGKSIIGGPLLETGSSNAQLLLPQQSDAINLTLIGAGLVSTGEGLNSTIWQTLQVGPGHLVGRHIGINQLSLVMRGITLRCPQAAKMNALDLRHVTWADIGIRVDVPGVTFPFTIAQATDPASIGIITPENDIAARIIFTDTVVVGYHYGVQVGELCGGVLSIAACTYAIQTVQGSHPSAFDYILVTNCPNTITGGGPLELNIQMLDIEHDTAAGSGPPWVEPHGYDIDDPGNGIFGHIYYHMHDATPFTVNGAINIRLDQTLTAGGVSWGNAYPGITALTNGSSAANIVGRYGGAPWLLFRATTTDPAAFPGVISWTNGSLPGPDYRLAQLAVVGDGDYHRGKVGLSVWRDGVETAGWLVDSLGNLNLPNIKSAVDDTAAAAAGVPVKGLYHNSGAVRVRLV